MELRQLRTFEAVVRHRTVTDAAAALDLAPSTVSEQIRALERSLGVAVFTRTARGMRLTAAGETLAGWARRLLDQAEQARREVAAAPRVVRLGALETIAASHAPGVLGRIAARDPDLAVDVRPSRSRDELMTDVLSGDLDAALLLDVGDALGDLGFAVPGVPGRAGGPAARKTRTRRPPVGLPVVPEEGRTDASPGGAPDDGSASAGSVAFADVEPVPLVLVAHPGHPLRDAPGLDVDDLRGERLLTNVPNCSFLLAADRLFGTAVPQMRAEGVAVMRAWAEQGLGIALLPEFAVAPALRAGTLARLPFPAPPLQLRLVWRAGGEDDRALRTVLYAAAAGAGSSSGRSPNAGGRPAAASGPGSAPMH